MTNRFEDAVWPRWLVGGSDAEDDAPRPLADEIEALAAKLGEEVETVVIAWPIRLGEKGPGRTMSWAAGKERLGMERDTDYGGADTIPPIYAYTKSWVIFVKDFDRAVHLVTVPRHPVDGVDVEFK